MDSRRFIALLIVLIMLFWVAAMLAFYRRMHAPVVKADAYAKYARAGGYFQITVDIADSRCPAWLAEEYRKYRKRSVTAVIIGAVAIAVSIYQINEYLIH